MKESDAKTKVCPYMAQVSMSAALTSAMLRNAGVEEKALSPIADMEPLCCGPECMMWEPEFKRTEEISDSKTDPPSADEGWVWLKQRHVPVHFQEEHVWYRYDPSDCGDCGLKAAFGASE